MPAYSKTFLSPKSRLNFANAAKLLMSMTFAAKRRFSGSIGRV